MKKKECIHNKKKEREKKEREDRGSDTALMYLMPTSVKWKSLLIFNLFICVIYINKYRINFLVTIHRDPLYFNNV